MSLRGMAGCDFGGRRSRSHDEGRAVLAGIKALRFAPTPSGAPSAALTPSARGRGAIFVATADGCSAGALAPGGELRRLGRRARRRTSALSRRESRER